MSKVTFEEDELAVVALFQEFLVSLQGLEGISKAAV